MALRKEKLLFFNEEVACRNEVFAPSKEKFAPHKEVFISLKEDVALCNQFFTCDKNFVQHYSTCSLDYSLCLVASAALLLFYRGDLRLQGIRF